MTQTINEKKEYLQRAKGLDHSIRCNEQELEEIRQLAMSVGITDYEKERVQESSYNQEAHFTKKIECFIEMEKKIKEDTLRLLNVKIKIHESVQSVKNLEERSVLQNKYLLGKTWEEISEELHMSISTACRIHEKALNHLTF
ncbi:MAG: sigma factor-like helix-turn-helix DNA-binding protein [Eubacteriales bacterium]